MTTLLKTLGKPNTTTVVIVVIVVLFLCSLLNVTVPPLVAELAAVLFAGHLYGSVPSYATENGDAEGSA